MTTPTLTTYQGTATPVLYLDLDGTVRHGRTELGRFVNGPDDVVVFPEAIARMKEWRAVGGRIVGCTNQGGIALGLADVREVEAAVERTDELTGGLFDAIMLCPHHPDASTPAAATCWCRKPKPGMVIEGAAHLRLLDDERAGWPRHTYPAWLGMFVGDRPEDRECAVAAGITFMSADAWRAGVLDAAAWVGGRLAA